MKLAVRRLLGRDSQPRPQLDTSKAAKIEPPPVPTPPTRPTPTAHAAPPPDAQTTDAQTAAAPTTAAQPVSLSDESTSTTTVSMMPITLWSVGGALALGGATALVLAKQTHDDAWELYESPAPEGGSQVALQQAVTKGERYELIGYLGLGIGAAVAASGLAWWLLEDEPLPTSTGTSDTRDTASFWVAPAVGASWYGCVLSGSWL